MKMKQPIRLVCRVALFVALVGLPWQSTAKGEPAADAATKKLVLADFEDGTAGAFRTAGTIMASKALDGKALFLKGGQNIAILNPRIDWLAYSFLKVDIHNPGGEPTRCQIQIKDDSAPHGYYSWVNRYFTVKPGKSAVEFYLPALKRGEGSPKDSLDPRPFHWKAVRQFHLLTSKGRDVWLDNVRLEKVELSKPESVLAFDFGPVGSPVLLGLEEVTPKTAYSAEKGYGWTRSPEIYARRRSNPPDDFVGDWISGRASTFSVKLTNGTYEVWLICEDPADWELYQYFDWRRIEAEGKTVFEEKLNGEQFLDRYFHFAETEDLPGEDIYKKYIGWRYPTQQFKVEVTDGRLDLTVQGPHQYACTVNGVVIYPEKEAEAGKNFVRGLMERRRASFYKKWNEKKPKRRTPDPALKSWGKTQGCVVFRRDISEDLNVYDAPRMSEVIARPDVEPQPIKVAAARSEYEPFAFSLYALQDLPELTTEISDCKSADGMTLPASAFDVRVVRYKFRRIGFAGAGMYGVVPWLLADGMKTSVKKEMVRRFWITVHVPKEQPAGVYMGTVRVSGSATLKLPVELRVLPVVLPDADMGLGMFGIGGTAPYFAYYAENRSRNEADRERSLAFAREHGFTHVGVGGVTFKGFPAGKAQYDFSKAQEQVKQARRLGYASIDLRGENRMARQALDDKGALAKKHGFASSDDLVREVFGAALRGAKANGLPDPIWSFGDEPPDSQAPGIVAKHRRMRELAGARSTIAWSPHGAPTQQLLDVTSICNLNQATLDHFKRAKAAGNSIYLNNQGRSRWAYGLYMWKARQAGVEAYQQFIWLGTHADPFYPLDSIEDDGASCLPDRDGNLRPCPGLERIREGIDDYRYTLALTRAIERAAVGPRKEVAAEAREYVQWVLGNIQFEETRRDRKPQMSETELNEYRGRVQGYLLKLADGE